MLLALVGCLLLIAVFCLILLGFALFYRVIAGENDIEGYVTLPGVFLFLQFLWNSFWFSLHYRGKGALKEQKELFHRETPMGQNLSPN